MMTENKILEVRKINKVFTKKQGLFKKDSVNHVINDVSLSIGKGKTYGLVGESGSGKSTLARLITRLIPADSGEIYLDGDLFSELKGDALRKARRKIRMVFQNPAASLNPRMNIDKILRESLVLGGQRVDEEKIREAMEQVGLGCGDLKKYPGSFSGGQAQRIAVARCLLAEPELMILDEPVSALDVSIQAQILNLLLDLQKENNLSYLFISHDLSVTKHISDTIGVLYMGYLVEEGPAEVILDDPLHPYTKMLAASVSRYTEEKEEIIGEIPSPFDDIKGCPFYDRCRYRLNRCGDILPKRRIVNGRLVMCHLYDESEV